jgi:transcription elongation GreA/GreB family factor
MMRFPQYTLKHAAASVYRPPVKRNFLRRLYQYLKLFTYPRGRSSHIRRFLGRIHGSYRRVLLSENDYYRLLAMLTVERKKKRTKPSRRAHLRYLLRKVDLRPIRLVPRDVITMNSRFWIATKQGTRFDLQLVYPDTASKSAGRISILSWLGMCLLGKRQGDRIGSSLWVEKVFYQPEDSNHFHL